MKCIRMNLEAGGNAKKKLQPLVVQQHARAAGVEGLVQKTNEEELKIIACGSAEKIDSFIDAIHKEAAVHGIDDVAFESFLKDRDYRGVFRVIE